jgi:hypothetical protein
VSNFVDETVRLLVWWVDRLGRSDSRFEASNVGQSVHLVSSLSAGVIHVSNSI